MDEIDAILKKTDEDVISEASEAGMDIDAEVEKTKAIFEKAVAKWGVEFQVNMAIEECAELILAKLFDDGAEEVEEHPEYWIGVGDGGLSYCYECAVKEVERMSKENPDEEYSVDGGWGGCKGDSQTFCENCGRVLDNSFTQYACETEVDHFIEYGFDIESGDDCLAMPKVISSAGWRLVTKSDPDIEFYGKLHRLCRKILKSISNVHIVNAKIVANY